MKPVVIETILMSKSVACPMPVSYEANIMEEAKKQGKKIIGLEAAQEQLEVLNTVPDDSVVAGIMQMTDSFSASHTEYANMLAAYRRQDLPALDSLINSSKEFGDDLGAFLDDRNKKWIPRMAGIMQRGPVFFAVGAGHLSGKNGVIALLRKAGYTVDAVK